ncbi:hypothetical protein QO003_000842 [Arthrobacter silviterrae]|uniref:Uncharacterized protein n=1 Tax=Arthrobacter silviterrae TaxID=2026658 RepID=A0ABX0DG87_9MICC|nr:hypothetical protein [Arthrobacter silviterrae]MDQ0276539.1 hypothetical protein [Arthrobacter silviterrae]NGN85628.1 hypothetical protein [Arthrobacter silviterrae]
MAISTGGIVEDWGPPRWALQEVKKQVATFAPRQSDQDYVVDVAFRSWHLHKEPEFTGVQAAMVGRKQRRFIVWHSVPKGLDTAEAVRDWLVSVLPETARLVREYLPGKSKSYPSEELAAEIDGLREMLLRTEYVVHSPT